MTSAGGEVGPEGDRPGSGEQKVTGAVRGDWRGDREGRAGDDDDRAVASRGGDAGELRSGDGGDRGISAHGGDGDGHRSDGERVGFGEEDAAGGGLGRQRGDGDFNRVGGGAEAGARHEAQAGRDNVIEPVSAVSAALPVVVTPPRMMFVAAHRRIAPVEDSKRLSSACVIAPVVAVRLIVPAVRTSAVAVNSMLLEATRVT